MDFSKNPPSSGTSLRLLATLGVLAAAVLATAQANFAAPGSLLGALTNTEADAPEASAATEADSQELTACDADLNNNGIVEQGDRDKILFNWGQNASHENGDVNYDGVVNDIDNELMNHFWGQRCDPPVAEAEAEAEAVPTAEPTAVPTVEPAPTVTEANTTADNTEMLFSQLRDHVQACYLPEIGQQIRINFMNAGTNLQRRRIYDEATARCPLRNADAANTTATDADPLPRRLDRTHAAAPAPRADVTPLRADLQERLEAVQEREGGVNDPTLVQDVQCVRGDDGKCVVDAVKKVIYKECMLRSTFEFGRFPECGTVDNSIPAVKEKFCWTPRGISMDRNVCDSDRVDDMEQLSKYMPVKVVPVISPAQEEIIRQKIEATFTAERIVELSEEVLDSLAIANNRLNALLDKGELTFTDNEYSQIIKVSTWLELQMNTIESGNLVLEDLRTIKEEMQARLQTIVPLVQAAQARLKAEVASAQSIKDRIQSIADDVRTAIDGLKRQGVQVPTIATIASQKAGSYLVQARACSEDRPAECDALVNALTNIETALASLCALSEADRPAELCR